MRSNEWDEKFAKAGGRWWAILTGSRTGYALDVYPEEAVRYRRNLKKALGEGSSMIGDFASYQERSTASKMRCAGRPLPKAASEPQNDHPAVARRRPPAEPLSVASRWKQPTKLGEFALAAGASPCSGRWPVQCERRRADGPGAAH
jgi:hypothetical protein